MSIELLDITKFYQDQLILRHVDLTVRAGELFVLIGGSGSGKSTLLKVISGLTSHQTGRVALSGRDVSDLPPQERNVGLVFQNYALFKNLNVASNVEFGLKVRGVSAKERSQRREYLLELVGLGGFSNRMPSELSGGQRQRVALARALAFKPAVLLLDEPFGALDLNIRTKLRRVLREVQQELKVTTLMVTHDQEEAFELADRVGILDHGRLVEVGTPEELYHRPRTEFAATFIGNGNLMVGRSQGGQIKLGDVLVPFTENSPAHEEGSPVRILFRPECVRFISTPAEISGVSLGQGVVTERRFLGPNVGVSLQLSSLKGSRALAPASKYGSFAVRVESIVPSYFSAIPREGDEVQVYLSHYHVLDPSGLRFLTLTAGEPAKEHTSGLINHLLEASHGAATLLSFVDSEVDNVGLVRCMSDLQAYTSDYPRLHITPKVRKGIASRDISREIQEAHYDLLLLAKSSSYGEIKSEVLARKVLSTESLPVMLVADNHAAIKRILICTAGGEPGKNDVRFTGRIARYLSATSTVFHVLHSQISSDDLARAESHVTKATNYLKSLGIEADAKLANGQALEQIILEASSGAYDLVVVGASWGSKVGYRSAIDAMNRLLLETECSLLVIPTIE